MTKTDFPGGTDDLEQRIAGLLRDKLFEVSGPLDPETELFELGLDSMGIMQLLVSLEELLGAVIPGELVTKDNFRSTSRIAGLLRRLTAAAP
ncbi:MAG: acyl carrier protein [Chthoniobacterales bacterium]|nr:acyl carrier protein [Chthoniobacterales bacterium]